LGNLASISYGFAKDRSFVLPDNGSATLDGSVCQKCKNVVINENTITRFLAGKFTPVFIAEYFLTDSYLILLDLEKLVLDTRIETSRKELEHEIDQNNAQISSENNAWAPNCGACGGTEKVYWEFSPLLNNRS
jgi:DNA-directed RNA polymerase subunit M/transcription elongation factor TFIIS